MIHKGHLNLIIQPINAKKKGQQTQSSITVCYSLQLRSKRMMSSSSALGLQNELETKYAALHIQSDDINICDNLQKDSFHIQCCNSILINSNNFDDMIHSQKISFLSAVHLNIIPWLKVLQIITRVDKNQIYSNNLAALVLLQLQMISKDINKQQACIKKDKLLQYRLASIILALKIMNLLLIIFGQNYCDIMPNNRRKKMIFSELNKRGSQVAKQQNLTRPSKLHETCYRNSLNYLNCFTHIQSTPFFSKCNFQNI